MRALPGAGCGLELRFFLRGGWRVSILRPRAARWSCSVRLSGFALLLASTGVLSCVFVFVPGQIPNAVAEQALYVRGRLRGEFEPCKKRLVDKLWMPWAESAGKGIG